MSHQTSQAQVFLVIEVEAGREQDAAEQAVAIGKMRPATVLLAPTTASGKLEAAAVKPIVESLQGAGIAVLIANDAQLARVLRADGVHLNWTPDVVARFAEAREILGTRYIVGVDAGASRHDAMSLGEAGADYVAFGVLHGQEDRETAFERQVDVVAWWAEIFEVPCVALDVGTLAAASELADVGADFVARRVPAGLSGTETAQLVADTIEALRGGGPGPAREVKEGLNG